MNSEEVDISWVFPTGKKGQDAPTYVFALMPSVPGCGTCKSCSLPVSQDLRL
ncbi:MAG: hypothetical protein AAF585_27175 [Verrucomicrobiota bacterium]